MDFEESLRIAKENGRLSDEALIVPKILSLERELIGLNGELETLILANQLIDKKDDTDEMVVLKQKILDVERGLAEQKSELGKMDNGADCVSG